MGCGAGSGLVDAGGRRRAGPPVAGGAGCRLHRLVALCLVAATLSLAPGLQRAQAASSKYSAIVVDAESGRVLRSENAQATRYPASLTKMMTLYLTFEALRKGKLTLDQKLPVSKHAASMSPTKIGVRAGQSLKVRDAILALITQSANDAAVVLAEGMAGSESAFARNMTAKAHALGMTRTTYRNASGLPDPDQVTTAADYALLSRALMRDFPEDYHYFSTRQFVWKGRTFGNHNHLLEKYDGTDGIKTGYINASGFNLAASAVRGGRRLICVMFGGRSAAGRDTKVIAMLDGGFADLGVSDKVMVASKGPTHHHLPSLKNMLATPAVAAEAPPPARTATARRRVASTSSSAAVRRNKGSWGVQVGAFSRKKTAEHRAHRAVQRAPKTLSGAQRVIARVPTDDGAIYRVRFLGLTEHGARRTCSRLKPAKIGCLPLSPAQQIASR
jgi:D-alanyl-D-alanine carboxypeptidase